MINIKTVTILIKNRSVSDFEFRPPCQKLVFNCLHPQKRQTMIRTEFYEIWKYNFDAPWQRKFIC